MTKEHSLKYYRFLKRMDFNRLLTCILVGISSIFCKTRDLTSLSSRTLETFLSSMFSSMRLYCSAVKDGSSRNL